MEKDGEGGEGGRRARGSTERSGSGLRDVNPLIIGSCSKILEGCNRRLSWQKRGEWARQIAVIMRKMRNGGGEELEGFNVIHHPRCEKRKGNMSQWADTCVSHTLGRVTQTAPLGPFWIPATITGTEPQTWLDFILTVHMSSSGLAVTLSSVEIELGGKAH